MVANNSFCGVGVAYGAKVGGKNYVHYFSIHTNKTYGMVNISI